MKLSPWLKITSRKPWLLPRPQSRPPSEVGGPRSGGLGGERERRRAAQTYRRVFTIVSLSLPDESVVEGLLIKLLAPKM